MATDYNLTQPIPLNDFLEKLPPEVRVVKVTSWVPEGETCIRQRLMLIWDIPEAERDPDRPNHTYTSVFVENDVIESFTRYGANRTEKLLTKLFNMGIVGHMKSDVGEDITSEGFFYLDDDGDPILWDESGQRIPKKVIQ